MTKKPLISVLMPAYNAAPYIRESIRSVLKQDGVDFELLVLNDGSRDSTADILRSFRSDSRIRIYSRQKNGGEAHSRNDLLRRARGRFVVNHDADDIMISRRLARQSQFLINHPRVGLVYGDALILDKLQKPFLRWADIPEETRRNHFFIPQAFLSSSMIQRSILLRSGGYDVFYDQGTDTDMWVKLSELTKFHYLRGATYIYRARENVKAFGDRWHRFNDVYHDRMVLSALRRRGSLRYRKSIIRIPGAAVHLSTNSAYIHGAVRSSLQPMRPHTGQGRLSIQVSVYEVPHTGGLYRFPHEYSPWDKIIHNGTDRGTLYWKSQKRRFVTKFDTRRRKAVFFISQPELMEKDSLMELVVLYPLICFTRPCGWNFIHSAAVSKANRSILIVGPSNAGKTTLSMFLLTRGFKLLSDETNILEADEEKCSIKGFPRNPRIKKACIRLLPEFRHIRRYMAQNGGNKTMIPSHLLQGRFHFHATEPRMLIHPVYKARADFEVRQLSFSHLLKILSDDRNHYAKFDGDQNHALNYILAIKRLASQAHVCRCVYSRRSLQKFANFIEQHMSMPRR